MEGHEGGGCCGRIGFDGRRGTFIRSFYSSCIVVLGRLLTMKFYERPFRIEIDEEQIVDHSRFIMTVSSHHNFGFVSLRCEENTDRKRLSIYIEGIYNLWYCNTA